MQKHIYEDLPSNELNIFQNEDMKLYSVFILYVSYTIYYIIIYIAWYNPALSSIMILSYQL